jgi:hypothetical protein
MTSLPIRLKTTEVKKEARVAMLGEMRISPIQVRTPSLKRAA